MTWVCRARMHARQAEKGVRCGGEEGRKGRNRTAAEGNSGAGTGGRTSDEKVPRAWVVLSNAGKQRGEKEVVQALHSFIQKNLSKYKWLRGGIEVVDEVGASMTMKMCSADGVKVEDKYLEFVFPS